MWHFFLKCDRVILKKESPHQTWQNDFEKQLVILALVAIVGLFAVRDVISGKQLREWLQSISHVHSSESDHSDEGLWKDLLTRRLDFPEYERSNQSPYGFEWWSIIQTFAISFRRVQDLFCIRYSLCECSNSRDRLTHRNVCGQKHDRRWTHTHVGQQLWFSETYCDQY